VIAVLFMVFKNPMLGLLGANEETISYASSYYSWIVLGAPFVIFSLVPTNLLRTEGFATGAMIGSITGSVVNMILDPIFIFTLGMGAGGAAIATVIGNICADIFYIYFITTKSKALSLNPKGFHISGFELRQILGIGIPSSITNIMQSIAVMLLNNFLVPYGNDKVAAMGIVSKVVMIVIMVMVSFSFGGQPLYGYLYGSGNKERMKETIRFAYMLVCGLGLGISAIIYMIAPQMISVFMKDAAVIQNGTPMLRAVLLGMPFIGYSMVTTCIFQSTGKAMGALLLSAGRQGYIYATVLFLASKMFGFTGVIYAQTVSEILTTILAFVLFQNLVAKELQD
ncbi:MAG: MATE family efflux transporter, partial [Solobacterium sp.]|nr:MATE family efflux transporter [Solobacterium sp.]